MIFHVPWHDGVNLCTIVQEIHAALPVNSYPGYILNLIQSVKGVRNQEGSLCMAFYTLGIPSCVTFGMAIFPWGAWPSFLSTVHSFCLKVPQPWAIVDEVVWAITVITMLLPLLSIFHCSGKLYNELSCHAFNAIWVLMVNDFLLIGTLLF